LYDMPWESFNLSFCMYEVCKELALR